MDMKFCQSVLFVKDIEISKDFYCNVLHMEIELDFGKNVILKNGLTIWEIHSSHIIPSILGNDNVTDVTKNRFELYFETENLEELVEHVRTHNVQFLHAIHEEPWGQRTIRFFDPDHHLIEIGESLGKFLNRFYEQGLTFDQISEKTGVPLDEIRRLVQMSR